MGKKILVIGTPRSGTVYISSVLRTLKLDVAHERMGRDGMVDWEATFWDKEPPYKRKEKGIFTSDFGIIFHQTRHPIPTIESMHIINENNWVKARACVKEMNEADSRLLSCMKFYYYYNLKAASIAGYQYRIENIKNVLIPMLKLFRVGIENEHKIDEFLKKFSTSTHTLRHKRPHETGKPQYGVVSWELMEKEDSILTKRIKIMARNYGYEIR